MGEYIDLGGKIAPGGVVKLGTCQSLYYARYDQVRRAVRSAAKVPGNAPPLDYIKERWGWRYRFPFPDEDHIPIGEFTDFDRGLDVRVYRETGGLYRALVEDLCIEQEPTTDYKGRLYLTVAVVAQRLQEGRLWVVIRNPAWRLEMWRLDPDSAAKLCDDLFRSPYRVSGDKAFRCEMIRRILAGYDRPSIEEARVLFRRMHHLRHRARYVWRYPDHIVEAYLRETFGRYHDRYLEAETTAVYSPPPKTEEET